MTIRVSVLLLPLILIVTSGCSPGVNWRAFAYNAEQLEKDRGDKAAMVYFRHWAVIECTKFEENVLKQPDVLTATEKLYCVVLNYSVDQKLAQQWSVSEPPGIAIVGSGGKLLASASGYLTRESLLALIQRGVQEHSGANASGENNPSAP